MNINLNQPKEDTTMANTISKSTLSKNPSKSQNASSKNDRDELHGSTDTPVGLSPNFSFPFLNSVSPSHKLPIEC